MSYTGQCHCGRITLTIDFLVDSVTTCNCSICRRYNAVWGYYRRDQVTLDITEAAALPYQWNDCMIDFVHCRFCGCITHYEDVELTPESRLAVNFRMFAPSLWEAIRVRIFDGADTFQEIFPDR